MSRLERIHNRLYIALKNAKDEHVQERLNAQPEPESMVEARMAGRM